MTQPLDFKELANRSIEQGDPTSWFEALYKNAQGDAEKIPWAKLAPHTMLHSWLTQQQPQDKNKKALVIGCGLGDDSEILVNYGYQVTAFDISPTAIFWCQKRFPQSFVNYLVADLFNLDVTWQQQFDLVIESRTIQALPLSVREEAIKKIAQLVAPQGILLVITRIKNDETVFDGPPWPVSLEELNLLNFQLKEQTPFYDAHRADIEQQRLIYQNI